MLDWFLKKFAIGLGVWFTIFFTSTCFCESQVRGEPSEQRHHIGFGPDFLLYKWNKMVGAVKSKGSQLFGGIRLKYEYLSPGLFYLGIDSVSFVAIKGYGIRNNGQPLDSSHDADRRLGHIDLRLGCTFSRGSHGCLISPFLGIGRYLFQDDQCHYCHTIFKQDIFDYVSGGIYSKCRLADRLDLGCRLKVFYVFSERVLFRFQGKQIKEEKKLCGGECSVPIVWHMSRTKHWDVGLEPYVLALSFAKEQMAFGAKLLFEFNF